MVESLLLRCEWGIEGRGWRGFPFLCLACLTLFAAFASLPFLYACGWQKLCGLIREAHTLWPEPSGLRRLALLACMWVAGLHHLFPASAAG